MCVSTWAGVTYFRYTVLKSPKKGKTAVHCCDPALSGSCYVGVSKRFSRSISFAVYYPNKTCTWSAVNVKKHVTSISSKLEPIFTGYDGHVILVSEYLVLSRFQLTITWMSKNKNKKHGKKPRLSLNLFAGVWPPPRGTPSLSPSCVRVHEQCRQP